MCPSRAARRGCWSYRPTERPIVHAQRVRHSVTEAGCGDVTTDARSSKSQALEVRVYALSQETWLRLGLVRARVLARLSRFPWSPPGSTVDTLQTLPSPACAHGGRVPTLHLRDGLVDQVRSLLPVGVSVPRGALRFLLAHERRPHRDPVRAER